MFKRFRLTLIIVLVIVLSITSILVFSQDDDSSGAGSRDIGVEPIENEKPVEIEMKVEVKKPEDDFYQNVELILSEDGFFDMPTQLSQDAHFRVDVKSTAENTMYVYLLNVTPDNRIVNLFSDYHGIKIEPDETLKFPDNKRYFCFYGKAGREIFIVLTSKNKISNEEALSLYDVKEVEIGSGNPNENSRQIGVGDEDKVEENDARIYGFYVYTY